MVERSKSQLPVGLFNLISCHEPSAKAPSPASLTSSVVILPPAKLPCEVDRHASLHITVFIIVGSSAYSADRQKRGVDPVFLI